MTGVQTCALPIFKAAAQQTEGKSGKSLAPVMMALITNANKRGIQFSPDEVSLIMDIVKDGKPKEEKDQIENMVNMVTSYMKKGPGTK